MRKYDILPPSEKLSDWFELCCVLLKYISFLPIPSKLEMNTSHGSAIDVAVVAVVAINIEGNAIAEVSQTKFVGVYIINKLTWKKHIHYIAGKLSTCRALVAKTRTLWNSDALITLYYSIIYPYLCYCNHVWGCTYASNLEKLIVLQKRIFRLIIGAKPKDHTEPMFLKLGLLKYVD